jgi:hypothetical protein
MTYRTSPIVRALAAVAASVPFALSLAQVDPPSWWGTRDGFTSFFCWQFNDPSFPPRPDLAWDPFGPPVWDLSGATDWFPQVTDHLGVWGVPPGTTGDLFVTLRNRRREDFIKHVWLQVDFFEDASAGSDVTLLVNTEQGSTIGNIAEKVDPLGSGWYRSTVTFDIRPQPNWESFNFKFIGGQSGAFIDNLYIGTHCVPEPASLLAVGVGLAALAARRRRR